MKLATIATLLVLALIAGACAGNGSVQPTEEESAAIYAAVVRQVYTLDDTFGGTLQPPTLYILDTTDESVGDPESPQADAIEIPGPMRESVTARLADLPTEVIWVETRDDAPLEADTGAVADGGALITLGNVAPQSDGLVHVPASIYVANLAAGGQTYVLEEVDGVWTVTGSTGAAWIS